MGSSDLGSLVSLVGLVGIFAAGSAGVAFTLADDQLTTAAYLGTAACIGSGLTTYFWYKDSPYEVMLHTLFAGLSAICAVSFTSAIFYRIL